MTTSEEPGREGHRGGGGGDGRARRTDQASAPRRRSRAGGLVPPRPWTVWLTGASSGIGEALAAELAARGCALALFARRRDRLEALAERLRERDPDVRVLVQQGDVRERDSVHAAVEQAERELGALDVALLNAGVGDTMDASEFDATLAERTIAINYLGAVYGIEAVLPGFLARERGLIVGMSSTAAVRGMPGAGPYCASKSALTAMLESLRPDLASRGVGVITVSPGFVRTPLTARNHFPMPFLLEPEVAARRIADALERGRRDVHLPRRLTIPVRMLALAPVWLWDWGIRRFVLGRGYSKQPEAADEPRE